MMNTRHVARAARREQLSQLWQTPEINRPVMLGRGQSTHSPGSEVGPGIDCRAGITSRSVDSTNTPSGCSHTPKLQARSPDWDLAEEDEEESSPSAGERLAVDESIAGDPPPPLRPAILHFAPRARVRVCESCPIEDETWREQICVNDFPNIKINELIYGVDLVV